MPILLFGLLLPEVMCNTAAMADKDQPSESDIELAETLLVAWDKGKGKSKSQLEIETWGDATSHGRHFDRFIRSTLGVTTTKPSKQTTRIELLEQQIRGLGRIPIGSNPTELEAQIQHARSAILQAVRVWNDPVAGFRTATFSLLVVAAWNSLAIALLMQDDLEWREIDDDGKPRSDDDGVPFAMSTPSLIAEAFSDDNSKGLRANVQYWIDIRNAVAHRYLPQLDGLVIPNAQAGLLNFEEALVQAFGEESALAETLTVPLQLSGFRDPTVLASRKKMQSQLPLDVQAVLTRAETADPALLSDRTFQMRVAFVPVVPSSGRSPDAVSYFVKPDEVPTELAEMLDRYVVVPKFAWSDRPNLSATDVIEEFQRRTGWKLNTSQHAEAARTLGARPPRAQPDQTVDLRFAEYITSFKRYLYSQVWIDELVRELQDPSDFERITGKSPKSHEPPSEG